MEQKTVFLNFYKTEDYFFDLTIKTKELCGPYIFLEKLQKHNAKHLFRRTPLGKLLLEHLEMISITFLPIHHFSRSNPPKKLQKRSLRCVHLLRKTHLGTAFGTLEIVLNYFPSVQFYLCPPFWQIYFKCFLYTA